MATLTTTNFDKWLNEIDLSDFESVDSLFRSVSECDTFGEFKTITARGGNGRLLVSCDGNDCTLLLATETAKQAFLRHIERNYCEGMSEEAWYNYHRAMQKD